MSRTPWFLRVSMRATTLASVPMSIFERLKRFAGVASVTSPTASLEVPPQLAAGWEPFPLELLSAASTDWSSGIPPMSPQDRTRLNAELARQIRVIQRAVSVARKDEAARALHPKGVAAFTNARLTVRPDMPPVLSFGPFTAGAAHRAIVRLSNASSTSVRDAQRSRRGIALRVTDDAGHRQDLLMTTGAPAFFARDGVAAVTAAAVELQGVSGAVTLIRRIGFVDAVRLLYTATSTENSNESLCASTYHSRAPLQLGAYAVKLRLSPRAGDRALRALRGADQLTEDVRTRLAESDVEFVLEAQFNRDPSHMADARIDWKTPYVSLGRLVIPRQALSADDMRRGLATVDSLSFKPGNRWDSADARALKPLGELNESREAIYTASAEAWGAGGVHNDRCPMGFERG